MRLPGPNLNLDRTSVRFNRFRFRTSVQNRTSASLNGRDLASTCVLRPRLEELVSLNFRGTELRSRRRIGLRSELRLSYNIQTGETTEVELQFIYADSTE